MNLKYNLLILVSFIFCTNTIYADTTLINIELDLNNITKIEDNSPNQNLEEIIPHKKFLEVQNTIREKTKLGRTIEVNYHLVNYEPSKELYSSFTRGFHLFDFTWYRLRTSIDYKINDEWVSMMSVPTGFNFKPNSKAIVHSYGDVPILISPTICPNDFCLGGGGEHIGKFPEKTLETIKTENYRIKIVEYPITKSVYLKLNNSTLMNKKLELEGSFILGDSAIETDIKPTYYPFDSYNLELLFTSYYDSKVSLYMEDIEDLSLSSDRKIEFEINKNSDKKLNLELRRGNSLNLLFEILVSLIPLVFYILDKKDRLPNFKIRFVVYLISILSLLILTYPTPLNVPKTNIFNISIWILIILLILLTEFLIHKDKKKK